MFTPCTTAPDTAPLHPGDDSVVFAAVVRPRGDRAARRASPPAKWRQGGFTLVELLVVITIIGILIALLLPAVQAAREAARRVDCANRLKQIGLAIHNYHAAARTFPPGNLIKTVGVCPGSGGASAQSEDGTNWMISILPYVEQQALYERYDFSAYNEGLPNKSVRETAVAAYVCPSDQATSTLEVPGDGPAAAMQLPYMPGSYRAVTGRSDGYRYLDSGDFSNYPLAWRGPIHAVGAGGFTTERIDDVVDGTSNTLMVGESTTRTNRRFRTFWAYSYAHFSLSGATPQERGLWGDYDRCVAAGGAGSTFPCRRGWGSFHPGGMNFALCDGSVRFIPQTIDVEVLAQLATISGGEVAKVPAD